jgi:2-(1,2-epoxy-1,2-dihydrophenyl)acetyl-CoA isomerase
MDYAGILYERFDDVVRVRLNRPETLNALTREMGEELIDAIDRARNDARAMLICGAGRAFCSGADLGAGVAPLEDPERDAGILLDATFHPLIARMRGAPIPIVTAVRGPAAGMGSALALAGDLIVAGEGAAFIQAFCKIGLVPDGGTSYLLSRAIGRPRAMELMLLGGRLPAAKALDWGLINRVVPDEIVDEAGLDLARELAAGPSAIGLIKRGAWAALDASFESVLDLERAAQREAGRSADFVEGVTAFRDKRPPRFSGT